MRIAVVSPPHLAHGAVTIPEADVLVHAGDFCGRGTLVELEAFAAFFRALPHRHKILIAGNHDWPLEREREQAEALLEGCGYLRDGAVTIDGVAFYGSPWQPAFLGWAFNLDRGEPLAAKWRAIPDDTDVLITHGPPAGIGDLCSNGDHAGCSDLLARVREVKPRYHLFGHIHEGYGVYPEGETTFVNASICTASYQPTQAPIVVEL